jgi:hypothetical protein
MRIFFDVFGLSRISKSLLFNGYTFLKHLGGPLSILPLFLIKNKNRRVTDCFFVTKREPITRYIVIYSYATNKCHDEIS